MSLRSRSRGRPLASAFLSAACLFSTCLLSTAATACDGPASGTLAERFESAGAVAVVRVTSLEKNSSDASMIAGKAAVVEILKGAPADVIPIYGYTPSVDCWAPIDVDRDYVVFWPDAAGKGDIWFSSFSGNVAVGDVPASVLEKWRAIPQLEPY